MATVLQMQGKMQEAIPHLERSIGPEVFVPSRARLVLSFMGTGRQPEAEALLDQLLQAMPNNPDAWLMKAALFKEQGRTAEAVELFGKITESYMPQPQDAPLFNYEIAELFSLIGQSSRAAEFYAKAISALPDFPNALNDFAWLLATDPSPDVRNGPLAVQYAERACELSQWKQPIFMGTLAAAYAEAGRFDDAVKMAGRARDLATAIGAEAIANRNAELLELYRQKMPFREVGR
jgi:tetratricopeptide (TPR) repeat protein